MPPVKGGSAAPRNPLHRRLLALAQLVAPPDQKVTLAYLERRAKLKRDALKDSARRGSISKPVAAALIAAGPALGIAGLTADWLHYERGPEPHKGGEMPPAYQMRTPPAGDSPTGGSSGRVAESDAPAGVDLIEEIVHHPEQFARRMEKMAADIGVAWTIAWMDGAEKILRQNGLDYSAFFTAIRKSLRADGRAAASENA